MAYVQTQAIITRLREVLESGYGSARTITAGTYVGNVPQGLSESEQKRRALVAARVRVNLDVTGRSPNSPPINGDLILYDATVRVTVSRLLARGKQLTPDDYDVVQAAGAADTDVIRQALEYPGNLSTTEAGAPTDIVSGMLRWQSSATNVVGDVDAGAQRLETVHAFSAVLIARPVNGRVVEFTADGTWDVPAGITSVVFYCWGAGGGGGAAATYGGGGGGGGSVFVSSASPVTPGETITVVIGQGGAAGAAGTDTTVTGSGGTATIPSGAAGVAGTIAGQGAGGAGGSGGITTYAGGAGGGGGGSVTNGGGGGGSAGTGGVGGAGASTGTRGTAGMRAGGGVTDGGVGGTGAAGSTAAVAGAFPGGGGGGASTGAAAAAGADGYVLIVY